MQSDYAPSTFLISVLYEKRQAKKTVFWLMGSPPHRVIREYLNRSWMESRETFTLYRSNMCATFAPSTFLDAVLYLEWHWKKLMGRAPHKMGMAKVNLRSFDRIWL